MSANTSPIFLEAPKNSWVTTGTSANTAMDGTGTVATVFTADATDGGKIEKIRLVHLGSNVATVVRFFINNGSTNASATNNSLVYEITMAANTVSQTAASVMQELKVDWALAPGYKLNVTIGTAIASGIQVTALGGAY